MPRKKSAAKKAKQLALKEAQIDGKTTATDANVQKVEEKLSEVESEPSEESSSSEDEDDYGELITEEVEEGIQNVFEAIKNNDVSKLLNSDVKFFEDPEKAVSKLQRSEKQRPIYLKDYHRMNLLAGGGADDFEEEGTEFQNGTVDGKQSYVSQQNEEKEKLLSEIKNAFEGDEEGDDDDEDDFLKKKENSRDLANIKPRLPDPNGNEDNFLEAFVNQQAWIPKKGDKIMAGDGEMKFQEDDDDFEDAAEKFEHAYNFRYEDPNSAEIVSYARNQATLRRSETTSRRRKREEKKETKLAEKIGKENAIQKKKTEKVHKITDVLEQLKKEYGTDIDKKMVKKITNTLLNSDFKDNEWDNVISELFNEEFYEQEGKSTWDDDDELMAEFNEQANDYKSSEEEGDNDEEEEFDQEETKKSRKELKSEARSKKNEKKKMVEVIRDAVEDNELTIADEVEEERKSRSRTREDQGIKFRYREVSPESFGLNTREIFAADDSQLNNFIGLKKFAPYRQKELRAKDKRKVTKSKRLRDWRKDVFQNENGLVDDFEEEIQDVAVTKDADKPDAKRRKHNKHKKHNE